MKNKNFDRTVVTVLGIAAYCFLILQGIFTQVYTWIPDAAFSIVLTFFCLWQWKNLKLTVPIFFLILFALFLHDAGILGFYSTSPLFLPWDQVTHFIGLFAVGVFFFNFFEDKLQKGKSFHNLFLLFIILLASLGVGSLIENVEFAGYTFLGKGEGVLYFGEGDGILEPIDTDMMNFAGGGWHNAMRDLISNLLGALAGIVVMLIHRHIILKK